MKKMAFVLLICSFVTIFLVGCGSKKISNDFITVNKYKGLEVDKSAYKDGKQNEDEINDEIWDKLLDECVVKKYDAEELKSYIEELELQYSYVVSDKSTPSELASEIHGMNIEELAKEQLKKKYAAALIAEKEGLRLTDSEYEKELKKQAEINGIASTEYEKMFGYEKLYQRFQEERVMQSLKDNLK